MKFHSLDACLEHRCVVSSAHGVKYSVAATLDGYVKVGLELGRSGTNGDNFVGQQVGLYGSGRQTSNTKTYLRTDIFADNLVDLVPDDIT